MKFGMSTMAAAALGNTFSDLLGIGYAWYVESLADKLGARPPDLSAEQLEMRSSRVAANLGRALGVFLGCLIGNIVLLYTLIVETLLQECSHFSSLTRPSPRSKRRRV